VLGERVGSERAEIQSRAPRGVHHRLLRREGLRGDDDQRRRRVEAVQRVVELGRVDVGDEAHLGPSASARSASMASCGPSAEPPMPMASTWLMRWPVAPSTGRSRTAWEKTRMRSRLRSTSGDVRAVDRHVLVAAQRRVQRRRFSVVLTRSPAKSSRSHRAAALARERDEERERLRRDALLREGPRDAGAVKVSARRGGSSSRASRCGRPRARRECASRTARRRRM
jgi:hypothetical protein